ncbi:MAG: Hsp20 family protein [Eubacterium sp.]|nr:Hsp20 family protein [Eubacterium sp.]
MYYPSIFNDNFTNDLFDEVMNFPFDYGKRVRNELFDKKRCTTDIKEFEDRYELDMELPGYSKEDIKAELKNGYLIVSAEHKEEKVEEQKEKSESEENASEKAGDQEITKTNPRYICRERFYGRTERSFFVGKDVAKEDIKANFVNGILTLTVPKVVKKPENEREYISIMGD